MKIFHPMEINTNTRMRWEVLRKYPEFKNIKGKKILDVGAGLGFFSVNFLKKEADVFAIDIDKKSLEYLNEKFNIKTKIVDLTKDDLPGNEYDIIFIGEVLEHINEPFKLLFKAYNKLKSEGVILISTPAMEGSLINTKGKKLGHTDGSEKHERAGFYYNELHEMILKLNMKIIHHNYCLFNIAEIFMQLSKLIYIKKKNTYEGQSDILNFNLTKNYKLINFIYSIFLFFFKIEQFICNGLKLKGNCHIFLAKK